MSQLPFVPTHTCRVFPDTWRGIRPEFPLSHLTDDEIDHCLLLMLKDGVTVNDIPRSQYGRRVAVDTMFKLERGHPVAYGVSVPTPYSPGQPR